MKQERVRMSGEGNGSPWETWKVLKEFQPVKYGDSVQGVTLLMMLSRELVTSCSSCGFSCRL